MDGEANGLGQRYYIQAMRLADEAGDPLMRATVLRSLTVQASELDYPAQALDLWTGNYRRESLDHHTGMILTTSVISATPKPT